MFTPGNFPGGLQSHPHRTSPQPGSATSSNNPPTGNNQVELPLQAWQGHLHLGSGGLLLVALLALAGTQEAELFISASATSKEKSPDHLSFHLAGKRGQRVDHHHLPPLLQLG